MWKSIGNREFQPELRSAPFGPKISSAALSHSAMPWTALAQCFDKPENKWPAAQS
jgi:hypothetical protein